MASSEESIGTKMTKALGKNIAGGKKKVGRVCVGDGKQGLHIVHSFQTVVEDDIVDICKICEIYFLDVDSYELHCKTAHNMEDEKKKAARNLEEELTPKNHKEKGKSLNDEAPLVVKSWGATVSRKAATSTAPMTREAATSTTPLTTEAAAETAPLTVQEMFAKVIAKMDSVDTKVSSVDTKVTSVDTKVTSVDTKVTSFFSTTLKGKVELQGSIKLKALTSASTSTASPEEKTSPSVSPVRRRSKRLAKKSRHF